MTLVSHVWRSSPEEVGLGQEALSLLVLTLLYSKLFNYPLIAGEIHRYFFMKECGRDEVATFLDHALTMGLVNRVEDAYVLPGAEALVLERFERAVTSMKLWAEARRYAALLEALPFVRMVAVTGSLAMNNVKPDDDIDFFIVTATGRLWLTRGLVAAIAKISTLRGTLLCPNFLLTEDNLTFVRQDLFVAHELAQMRPLFGYDSYLAVWRANPWVESLLPNALPFAPSCVTQRPFVQVFKALAERLLSGTLGAIVERWEYQRKSARLQRRAATEAGNVAFTPNECRGYFGGLEDQVLSRFHQEATNITTNIMDARGAKCQ